VYRARLLDDLLDFIYDFFFFFFLRGGLWLLGISFNTLRFPGDLQFSDKTDTYYLNAGDYTRFGPYIPDHDRYDTSIYAFYAPNRIVKPFSAIANL
jgi:hypothetical protein